MYKIQVDIIDPVNDEQRGTTFEYDPADTLDAARVSPILAWLQAQVADLQGVARRNTKL